MNDADQNRFGFALPDDPAHRDRLAEIGQLASGLVHELKNPLGAISLTVEMLQQNCADGRLDPARTAKRLDRIADGTQQLHNIIQSFLAFARPPKADKDRVDVNQVIEDLVCEMDEVFASEAITVDCKLLDTLKALPADANHLTSIFRNIMLNARDALRERESGRKILIVTRNGHESIRIMIANNGPPLGTQAAAHLFDPFFSAKDGGTGLGLAIVKRLVELHNGRINVTSSREQGVSFTIEFPTTLGPARSLEELPVPAIETEAEVRDSTEA